MAAGAQPATEPRIFRIFISYASEDVAIAAAIGTCFKVALPDIFAEVNLDKWFLQPGLAFKKQIEGKLQKTDVFIIVYTGAEKQSHGYTGWEVGYFDHVRETEQNRLKISLYLDTPPAITAEEQGIPLGLSREKLELSCEEFEAQLVVHPDEPLCVLLDGWQEEVGNIIDAAGLHRPSKKPDQEPAACVRGLKLAIFRYLKSTVESIMKPQKQVTIRVKGSALEQAVDKLPLEAQLTPMGVGTSLSIFGLPDEAITWKKFLESTAEHRFADSWREAITSVVMSSFPDKVNVDNSQVILSSDEVKAYRVILTTATKYFDDFREFNVYFVEMLYRHDYGDRETSYLLKGLDLICRFRFMFLETNSEFSADNILYTDPNRVPEMATRLLRELNMLRKEAREAGLDEPKVWRNFVTWDHIRTMSSTYRPSEAKLREIIPKIVAAKGQPDSLAQLNKEMSGVLAEMANGIRPENSTLIREMAKKLEQIVAGDALPAAVPPGI